jgi:hypothetical protein
LIDELEAAFGGIKCLAQSIHATYVTSKPGSAGQVRVLDLMGRLLLRRDGDEKNYENLDGYTLKQLNAELAKELGVSIEDVSGDVAGPTEAGSEPTNRASET